MRNVFALTLLVVAIAGCGSETVPPAACVVDGDCPLHQLCDGARCTSGCLSAAECGGANCGDHGRCDGAPPDAGADLSMAGGGDLSSSGGDLSSSGGDLSSSGDLSRAADLSGAVDLATIDAWICTGVCPDAALEPNNTPAQATVETDTVTLPNLALCPSGDVDLFKVTATRHGSLSAKLANGPCGPVLTVDILAADGTTVVGPSTPTTAGATASVVVNKNDVRYVRVTPKNAGDQNFYGLTIDVQ